MTTEAQIVNGSVVRFKAGGPAMTVERISGALVDLIWFDKNLQLNRYSEVNYALLEHTTPDKTFLTE